MVDCLCPLYLQCYTPLQNILPHLCSNCGSTLPYHRYVIGILMGATMCLLCAVAPDVIHLVMTLQICTYNKSRSGSSVGIATDYGLDSPGIESLRRKIFHPSRLALGSIQPPLQWVPGLSRGVKYGWGVLLNTHPLLVPQSWKSRALPIPTLWATTWPINWNTLPFI